MMSQEMNVTCSVIFMEGCIEDCYVEDYYSVGLFDGN